MIELNNVSKNYGDVEVIRDISFFIDAGEILGLLGPNGAGKTTIMRMLSGYHLPGSGTVKINGISLTENSLELKNHIGYLPENTPLYMDMTPFEYLEFSAQIRQIPADKKNDAIQKVMEICGLENRKNQRIETLSRGYRQRIGLAQVLLHDPPVLILDEPLSGLDPNQIMEMRSLIKTYRKNKTIIFSTHILQEVESICSKYIILNEGRIAARGDMEQDTSLEKIFIGLKGEDN